MSFVVSGTGDDLLVHRLQNEFNRYQHLICAEHSCKIKVELLGNEKAPLVYKQVVPEKQLDRKHMDVNRWHMKLSIKYVIEKDNIKIHEGYVNTRHSFQDCNDYGNIFLEDKGQDKLVTDLVRDVIEEIRFFLAAS